MSPAAVAADFHQAFNVQGFFTTKVPFHFVFMIQDFTQLGNFRFRQIPDTGVRVDPGFSQDFPGQGQTDPVNVRKSVLDKFMSRYIYTGDTSHSKHLLLILVSVYVSGFRK